MAGSVLGNRTRNFVLRLVVNGCKFTQSEVPNGTALPLVIEKLHKRRLNRDCSGPACGAARGCRVELDSERQSQPAFTVCLSERCAGSPAYAQEQSNRRRVAAPLAADKSLTATSCQQGTLRSRCVVRPLTVRGIPTKPAVKSKPRSL